MNGNTEDNTRDTETVFAKYVIGADGMNRSYLYSLILMEITSKVRIPGCDETLASQWRANKLASCVSHHRVEENVDNGHHRVLIEYVWGVTDVTLDTDFPDCRFKCVIQSSKGAVIVIPSLHPSVCRLYSQIPCSSFHGRRAKYAFMFSSVHRTV